MLIVWFVFTPVEFSCIIPNDSSTLSVQADMQVRFAVLFGLAGE